MGWKGQILFFCMQYSFQSSTNKTFFMNLEEIDWYEQ